MSVTTIILILGVLLLGIGIGKIVFDNSKDKPFRVKTLSLPILGFFMLITPATFAWIILGIINGFVALPQTIAIPRPSFSISPIWIGALLIGLIASVFAFFAIRRNAKKAGLSYGEYLESQMPQEDSDPVEKGQKLLHDNDIKDQTTTQQPSSDR